MRAEVKSYAVGDTRRPFGAQINLCRELLMLSAGVRKKRGVALILWRR